MSKIDANKLKCPTCEKRMEAHHAIGNPEAFMYGCEDWDCKTTLSPTEARAQIDPQPTESLELLLTAFVAGDFEVESAELLAMREELRETYWKIETERTTIHGAYCDLAELIKKANTGVVGNCEALEALIAQRDKLRAELERVKHGLHACIYQDEEGRMEILAVLRDSITLEGLT